MSKKDLTYWNDKGQHQAALNILTEQFLPDYGKVKYDDLYHLLGDFKEGAVDALEELRLVQNIYYDCYNNAACNLFYYDNEPHGALADYIALTGYTEMLGDIKDVFHKQDVRTNAKITLEELLDDAVDTAYNRVYNMCLISKR